MITLDVHVSGDHWLNPEELRDKLQTIPQDENLTLEFPGEGPSLGALGILEMLSSWCRDTGRNPNTIFLSRWFNNVESVPFVRINGHPISHFFWLCETYITDIPVSTHEYKFGMFIGRRTPSRMRMIWDVWQRHHDRCLFSMMHNETQFDPGRSPKGISLDLMIDWAPMPNIEEFLTWCWDPPIKSIDNHSVQDHYDPDQNINRDLLSHYHRFDIEIAVETYTRGDCFMPTEKTVRALSAGKPFLVFGPKNFLSRLREIGFKTYRDFWDESYDLLEGLERWQTLLTVIDRLSLEDISPETKVIAEHNRSLVQDLMLKYRSGY